VLPRACSAAPGRYPYVRTVVRVNQNVRVACQPPVVVTPGDSAQLPRPAPNHKRRNWRRGRSCPRLAWRGAPPEASAGIELRRRARRRTRPGATSMDLADLRRRSRQGEARPRPLGRCFPCRVAGAGWPHRSERAAFWWGSRRRAHLD